MNERIDRTVQPRDLVPGDRFRHKGALYEVIAEPTPTKFSNYDITARRISPERVTLDYTAEIEVSRVRAA